jgi:hypothetical protein
MRLDYDSWITTTMEPASVTEAKVYSLETRIKHEEKRRLEEAMYLRDMVKKLIFSMEQMCCADELEQSSILYMKRLSFVKQLAAFKPMEGTGDSPFI